MIKTTNAPSSSSSSPPHSHSHNKHNRNDDSPSTSYNKKHKTSLDFICSPSSELGSGSPSTPTASTSTPPKDHHTSSSTARRGSSPSYLSPRPPSPQSTFSFPSSSTTIMNGKAPKKTLEALPRELLALVGYYLVIENEHHQPVEESSTRGYDKHPSKLSPLLFVSKTIYESICFDNNPQLYNRLFRATFDVEALDRRYQWMKKNLIKPPPPPASTASAEQNDVDGKGKGKEANKSKKIFDLFSDPRSWAIDYRTRWEQSYRMRQVSKLCRIEIPGICDKEAYVADLWNVWFLLTENDGKNIRFLNTQCDLRGFIMAFYKENLLKESLVPGYPRDTGDKALAVWCCLLAGIDDLGEDTPAEVDEKIFMLRPYVFACAKYDIHYAPWHYRKLPFCPPGCEEHETDASIRIKAMTYKRFGYTWKRAPPHFVLGIYLVFMRLLERQPERVGLKAGSSTFSSSPFEIGQPSLFSMSKLIPSVEHDREWQRNTMCQDPHTSPGLPALAFANQIKGFWRGKFLFYDFDLYRQILAGNMRGVYTGTFAEQAAELELFETIVKLPKAQLGGKGPLLAAGFRDEFDEDGSEQALIKEGYGYELSDENEVLEEGWTKEILISGRARTSWGWAKMRGRVRSWDGLVIMEMTYSRHVMGRWIWKGYLHTGGYMVGRWRDTFTAENLRGYEGAFGLIRAGDPLYPDHFPKRMEDSLGVNANVNHGQGGGGGGSQQQQQGQQVQHSQQQTQSQSAQQAQQSQPAQQAQQASTQSPSSSNTNGNRDSNRSTNAQNRSSSSPRQSTGSSAAQRTDGPASASRIGGGDGNGGETENGSGGSSKEGGKS
ncbi:hypothetical protein I302_102008 [Kwoniella bestiolae CBS 10118]|uniref:Uncharacterized protein n=1 Tax=Kwoniella bestiolae CBS 10118 TaxID=1296100 RepID=A0A1B9GDV7_9TREE|nr:hypothetical protein I302_00692 [Kwoniella bestiolae CBS 10118]OCF29196.1 hypothetical protein I302_00692 [Kwoniella bestiolae CBS 10118]